MKLKDMLDILYENIETSSSVDIVDACRLIIISQDLTGEEIDVLRQIYFYGPIPDENLRSILARDSLLQKGLVVEVICGGKENYTACTVDGALVRRLL